MEKDKFVQWINLEAQTILSWIDRHQSLPNFSSKQRTQLNFLWAQVHSLPQAASIFQTALWRAGMETRIEHLLSPFPKGFSPMHRKEGV